MYSRNHCCRGKAVSIKLFCVSVALDMQHAKHLRLIKLSSVARQNVPYSSTLINKRQDFMK